MLEKKYLSLIDEIKKDTLVSLEADPECNIKEEIEKKYQENDVLAELVAEGYDVYSEISPEIPLIEMKVSKDEDPINPREDFDNLGTMWCSHSRYTLGDQDGGSKFIDVLKTHPEITDSDLEELEDIDLKSTSGRTLALKLAEKYSIGVIKPLFLYDHSGITMSTSGFSDRWDSGQVGVIFVSNEKIAKEAEFWTGGWREEHHKGKTNAEIADEMLTAEVSIYDDYITNNVWQYNIDQDGDIVQSCGGYFGDDGEKEAGKDASYEVKSLITESILDAIISDTKQSFKENMSMNIFKSKVAGEYDGELFGAIQMIAQAAKESGVPADTIFKGIAESDDEVMDLFIKR